MESNYAMSPLENFGSGEVRICWRHCSNNSGSLPLTPSGRSSLKSVDQNSTHSRNSCPEKDHSSYASSIVLHSCQKRICRHLFLFRGPPKCLFFSEQEVCKEYEWKRLRQYSSRSLQLSLMEIKVGTLNRLFF